MSYISSMGAMGAGLGGGLGGAASVGGQVAGMGAGGEQSLLGEIARVLSAPRRGLWSLLGLPESGSQLMQQWMGGGEDALTKGLGLGAEILGDPLLYAPAAIGGGLGALAGSRANSLQKMLQGAVDDSSRVLGLQEARQMALSGNNAVSEMMFNQAGQKYLPGPLSTSAEMSDVPMSLGSMLREATSPRNATPTGGLAYDPALTESLVGLEGLAGMEALPLGRMAQAQAGPVQQYLKGLGIEGLPVEGQMTVQGPARLADIPGISRAGGWTSLDEASMLDNPLTYVGRDFPRESYYALERAPTRPSLQDLIMGRGEALQGLPAGAAAQAPREALASMALPPQAATQMARTLDEIAPGLSQLPLDEALPLYQQAIEASTQRAAQSASQFGNLGFLDRWLMRRAGINPQERLAQPRSPLMPFYQG